MDVITLSLAISAMLFSLVTAVFSVLSYCKVIGMEKSTHQIQYIPLDDKGAKSSDELAKQMSEAMGLN